jgi:hypothetical protein
MGTNPMGGVLFNYFLKEKADTSLVSLEILDPSGKVVRSYTNKKDENFKRYPGGPAPAPLLTAEAGVNQFAWDFKTAGPIDVQGVFIYGDYSGHRVAPGKYRARLNVKGQISETEVEVTPDPRIPVSPADWTAQQEVLEKLTNSINEMHQSVNNIRKVRKQIEGYNEAFKDLAGAKEVLTLGKELIKKIDAWESAIVETRTKNGQDVINWPSKLSAELFTVRGKIDAFDPRITQGVRDRIRDLDTDWIKQKQALVKLLSDDVQAYNQKFRNLNIPALVTDLKP